MSARQLALTPVVCLCLFGVFVFSCVPARADITHELLSRITEVPASSGAPLTGPLSGVNAMTVDSGKLYVAEHIEGTNSSRVDVFDATSGAFVSQLAQTPLLEYEELERGVAVGHSTGEAQVYVGAIERVAGEPEGRVLVFDGSGSLLGAWTGADTPAGGFGREGVTDVAADNSSSLADWASGDVYVVAPNEAAVDVFKPEAGGGEKYVTQLTGPSPSEHFSRPESVTVDQLTGDVLVVDAGNVVNVFEPTVLDEYALVRQLTATPTGLLEGISAVATDGSNGDIYLSSGNDGVVQFSSTGVFLGRLTGAPGGASLAVDPASPHHVFVGAPNFSQGAVDVYGPSLVIPDVRSELTSNLKHGSVTLNGTVDPDGAGSATCQFAWGTSTAFGQFAPCSAPVADGNSRVGVQASLSGLSPDTTYHYRLQASNANGTNPGEEAEDQEFTTPGPGLHEESVLNIAATSVTFDAEINPHNVPTAYYFQYGTDTGYGADVPIPPGGGIGSGEGDVEVAKHVQGLLPGTVYHYRVVVRSELSPGEIEEFVSADQTFTTEPTGSGLTLPDGRAWEMVSPPDKHGALIERISEEGLAQAAVGGNAMTYLTSAPTELEPLGYTNQVQVLSRRDSDGWQSRDISAPDSRATGLTIGAGQEYRFFSEDLSLGIVQPMGHFTSSISPEASEQTAFMRTDYLDGDVGDPCVSACFHPLVTGMAGFANVPAGTVFGEEPQGECEHFMCGPKFVGASPDGTHVILESDVGLTATPGDDGGLYEWSAGKLALVSVLPDGKPAPPRVIPGGNTQISVVLGDGKSEEDEISKVHAVSDDGSHVLWSREVGQETKVYMRDMVAGTTVQVDVPQLGGLVIGASEDGSYVYFEAGDSLYVSHGGTTTLIAALSAADEKDWGGLKGGGGDLTNTTSRVSPDGRWFAFMSQKSLTGYDTRDAISGQLDEEVYLYDASTKRLTCASCNPSGARPVGVEYGEGSHLVGGFEVWLPNTWIASNVPGWTAYRNGYSLYQSRYLSDSGRLFFNSDDALVPQDVNGTEDVYEYEPTGVGDCSTSSVTFGVRSDGCVGLISSGSASAESAFLDASGSGGDVFFLTGAKLSEQDFDTSLDVYDAHECSAEAPCAPAPAAVPPTCSTGDSCKPAPSPQPPIFGSPSSATFSGTGNVTGPGSGGVVKRKSLTRAKKLANALKACARKPKSKRAGCRAKARKAYGARTNVKRSGR